MAAEQGVARSGECLTCFYPDQGGSVRVLEGDLNLWLYGEALKASIGDLIRMPMRSKHAVFNRVPANARALFQVAPALHVHDPFVPIDPIAAVGQIEAGHDVHPLPPPS